MILLLRAVVRLLTITLFVVLAVCGLAVAIFSIGGSRTGDFDLSGLARLVGLGELRNQVGELLHDLARPGPVAGIAVLSGLGAIAVGVLLLVGMFWPRRERLVVLETTAEGTLAVRRRVLGRAAGALAGQARGITATKVKVRPGCWRAARLSVRASYSRAQESQDVRQRTLCALAPLTEAFGLRTRVRPRLARRGRKVK
jgi:Na+/proline symporter